MARSFKYPASEALKVINGTLADELKIHRFDEPVRTKSHIFAIGGPSGKQFALVVQNYDAATGRHSAQQSRLIFEPCQLPAMTGIEVCPSHYHDSSVERSISRLSRPGQASCIVADETALRAILRWYAGLEPEVKNDASVEQGRIAQMAADAGFDLGPEREGDWEIFRSTAFPERIGISIRGKEFYRLGISNAEVGGRIGEEFELFSHPVPGSWVVRFDEVRGDARMHEILSRIVAITRVLHQDSLSELKAKTRVLPDSTEVMRNVAQRVGQAMFRRMQIEYWGGGCAVTGLNLVDVLRASHMKPWADCETDEERLDVYNGLLLAPHLDALFDKGLITFSDDGRMIRSEQLTDEHMQLLGIDERAIRRVLFSDKHLKYLAWHRSKVFRGCPRDKSVLTEEVGLQVASGVATVHRSGDFSESVSA